MKNYTIGLMSGTSLDGIDGVLLQIELGQSQPVLRVLAYANQAFSSELRAHFEALNQPGFDEGHRAHQLGIQLANGYAQVVHALLAQTSLKPSDIAAMGAHGQTVRHVPIPRQAGETPYTWQINAPAQLAEDTGITVIADFRSRDMAAGGQGAPLVPLFHQQFFGQAGHEIAVLNLGGIANLSLLHANGHLSGFDCGPGNTLMDVWCHRHTGQSFDAQGCWAQTGQVIPGLLAQFLQDPYFQQPPPKSTGRDYFHAAWLEGHLARFPLTDTALLKPEDVQATLLALTVHSTLNALFKAQPDCQQLWVCGGGAYNDALMKTFQTTWPHPVQSTQAAGIAPLQVEAAAFAWLAYLTLTHQAGNCPCVTGAKGPRVLGAIYPR
jgi:anhydro-N-acetylmuramic acid kinase